MPQPASPQAPPSSSDATWERVSGAWASPPGSPGLAGRGSGGNFEPGSLPTDPQPGGTPEPYSGKVFGWESAVPMELLTQPDDFSAFLCQVCHDTIPGVTYRCTESKCATSSIFCEECARGCNESSHTCPCCRASLPDGLQINNGAQVQQIRMMMHMKCPNPGCDSMGRFAEIVAHQADCPRLPLACTWSNGFDGVCGMVLPREEIYQHMRDQCEHRGADCPACTERLPLSRLEDHLRTSHSDGERALGLLASSSHELLAQKDVTVEGVEKEEVVARAALEDEIRQQLARGIREVYTRKQDWDNLDVVVIKERQLRESDIPLVHAALETPVRPLAVPSPSPSVVQGVKPTRCYLLDTQLTPRTMGLFLKYFDRHPHHLTTLYLNNNPGLGDEGVLAVARALRSIERLSLLNTGITQRGLPPILEALPEGMVGLGVNENPLLGDEGVRELARWAARQSDLWELWLMDVGMTDEGAGHLLGKLPKNLRHIYVYENPMTKAGGQRVLEAVKLVPGLQISSGTIEYDDQSANTEL